MKQQPSPDDHSGLTRSTSPEAFSEELKVLTEHYGLRAEWTVEVLAPLYSQTAGWPLAACAVVHGAATRGFDFAELPAERYASVVSTSLLAHMRKIVKDNGVLRLAHLITFLKHLTPRTIEVVADAVPLIGGKKHDEVLDTQRALSQLLENGVVHLTGSESGDQLAIPAVLREILRRFFDQNPGHSQERSKRAIGQVFSQALKSLTSIDSDCLEEAIFQSAENGYWQDLAAIWAERSYTLYLDHMQVATRSYAAIPDDQVAASALLAEARSFAGQIYAIQRRLGTDDALRVLADANFGQSGLSALQYSNEQIGKNAQSADDLVVLAIASMQRLKQSGNPSKALAIAEDSWANIEKYELRGNAPTRMNDMLFHLHRGTSALCAAEYNAATLSLRRAVLIGEITPAADPGPLTIAYAFSAMVNAVSGNGAVARDLIRKYQEIATRGEFFDTQWAAPYQTAVLVTALDELDIEAAQRASDHLTYPSAGDITWVDTTVSRVFLGIYTGAAGFAKKELERILQANGSLYSQEPRVRSKLLSARAHLLMATGQAEVVHEGLLGDNLIQDSLDITYARARFLQRDFTAAERYVSRVLSQNASPHQSKASARALQAACKLEQNRHQEATEAFLDALEYCSTTSSLQSIALLPQPVRQELIAGVTDSRPWARLASSFLGSSLDADTVRTRLSEVGTTLIAGRTDPPLSRSDIDLLGLLDRSENVSDLSARLNLAHGTVKNKLSRLYKALNVHSWDEAVALGYKRGYLPLSSSM